MNRLSSAVSLRAATLAVGILSLSACVPDQPTAPSLDANAPVASRVSQDDILPAPLNRVIVRFRGNSAYGRATAQQARERAAQAFAARFGARFERGMRLARTVVLEAPDGDAATFAQRLAGDPDVEFAEIDELIPLQPCETGECASVNDGFFWYKWDLHNTGSIVNAANVFQRATGAADADIDWLEMYDALGPSFSGSATIGIIDSGILPTHRDLAGKVIAAQNFATGYPITQTQDRDSHGTHVAGIAAAYGNDGVGVAGVGYGANIRLINAKSCERYLFPDNIVRTSCPTSSTADAIVWATDQGANVLNLSLGGAASATAGSAAQQAAFQYARGRGVLPICASGNDGSSSSISFPARFAECVAVGSTDWADLRATYSNASADVELSAPGGSGAASPFSFILAPIPVLSGGAESNGLYGFKAGTSMAAPQVAGLAAVLFAQGVGNDVAVLARLKSTVDDLGAPGTDAFFGAGRINACRAINPAAVRVGMPGSVNLGATSSAIVPVTLFGNERFNVSQFELAELSLQAGQGAPVALAIRGNEYRANIEDVDGDGMMDLALKFSRDALISSGNLQVGNRTFSLRGNVGCRRVQGGAQVSVRR